MQKEVQREIKELKEKQEQRLTHVMASTTNKDKKQNEKLITIDDTESDKTAAFKTANSAVASYEFVDGQMKQLGAQMPKQYDKRELDESGELLCDRTRRVSSNEFRQSSDEMMARDQSELFRPFLSRISDPTARSPSKNFDDSTNLNDKDRLNPYARDQRASRATMLRKTEGRY